MILDSGICTVFHAANLASPGSMPLKVYHPFWASWYGVLAFETSPSRPTEGRKELKTDLRIRVLQSLDIRQDDIVVLANVSGMEEVEPGTPVYSVQRAYHGQDDDGPAAITDLSLEVYQP